MVVFLFPFIYDLLALRRVRPVNAATTNPLTPDKSSNPATAVASVDSDDAFGVCADGGVTVGAGGCCARIVEGGADGGMFVLGASKVADGVGVREGSGCTCGSGLIGCGCPRNAMIAQAVI